MPMQQLSIMHCMHMTHCGGPDTNAHQYTDSVVVPAVMQGKNPVPVISNNTTVDQEPQGPAAAASMPEHTPYCSAMLQQMDLLYSQPDCTDNTTTPPQPDSTRTAPAAVFHSATAVPILRSCDKKPAGFNTAVDPSNTSLPFCLATSWTARISLLVTPPITNTSNRLPP